MSKKSFAVVAQFEPDHDYAVKDHCGIFESVVCKRFVTRVLGDNPGRIRIGVSLHRPVQSSGWVKVTAQSKSDWTGWTPESSYGLEVFAYGRGADGRHLRRRLYYMLHGACLEVFKVFGRVPPEFYATFKLVHEE